MSEAKDISIALSGRLAGIKQADGYLTDIGLRVYRGRRKLDESHIPCCVIVESDDDIADEKRGMVKIEQQYFIEGHAACDPDNPNDAAHDIIADIKRAVFAGDGKITPAVREVKYKGRSIQPREDGTAIISASIQIAVVFVEAMATP